MKRKGIIIALTLMSIGFALVTATLTINGVINLGFDAEDFDVYFSDAYLNEEQHKEFITQDGKNITFQTTLKSINERSILKYEVMNNSKQYDAEVTISCTPENDELLTITNNIDSTTITAQSKKEGNLTITLKKSVVEDISKDINCQLTINAIERTSKEEQQEASTYSFGGILMNSDETPIANSKVIVYSKVPHEVTTDENGYLYVEGLDRGSHEIYYVNGEVDASDKEAVKEAALASGNITTSYTSTEIKLNNGYEIKDVSVGKTSELIIASLETDVIDKKIVNGNTVTFPISGEYSNILCESEELPIEVNEEQVTIDNVNKSTKCYLSNDIYQTANKLKDEYERGFIKVLKNISGTNALRFHKETTMDIDGHEVKINYAVDAGIASYANLTLKDSRGTGKIINETMDAIAIGSPNITINTSVNIEAERSALRIYTGGINSVINVNGGNLKCTNVKNGEEGCVFASKTNEEIILNNVSIDAQNYFGSANGGGKITLNSGTIKCNYGISVEKNSVFNMNGGKIEAQETAIKTYGTTTITNGELSSINNYTIENIGTLNLNGQNATFSENGEYQNGIYLYGEGPNHATIHSHVGNVIINGGTIIHGDSKASEVTWRQHSLRLDKGSATINGGYFESKAKLVEDVKSGSIYLNEQVGTVNIKNVEVKNKLFINHNSANQTGPIVNICSGNIDIIRITQYAKLIYRQNDLQLGQIISHDGTDYHNVLISDDLTCE